MNISRRDAVKAVACAVAVLAAMVPLTGHAKEWKTVTIALEGSYEPWNLTRPDGMLDGFEPELAKNLCARIHVQCKLIAQDWDGLIPGLNSGKFDVIMDAIGGKSLRTGYNLLAPGGRLVAFGASSVMSGERRNLITAARAAARMPRFNLIKQMSASKAVIGLNMLTLWDHAGTLEPWIAPLREMLDDGTIVPVVAEAFPFDRAADAHRFIAERRNVGKVVLTP